jgi:hypothetical protein
MCEEKQQKEYDNIWERYLLYSWYLTWYGVDVNIHRLSFIHNQFKGIGLLVYGLFHHFQQYFSSIVAVSFIGRGNQSTR